MECGIEDITISKMRDVGGWQGRTGRSSPVLFCVPAQLFRLVQHRLERLHLFIAGFVETTLKHEHPYRWQNVGSNQIEKKGLRCLRALTPSAKI